MENTDDEITPVTYTPVIRKSNERKRNPLRRLIDYIMVNEGYLQTLSTEQIFNRATTTRTREELTKIQSTCEESYRDLSERTYAFVERLGKNYRCHVQNQAIAEVLHKEIDDIDKILMGL